MHVVAGFSARCRCFSLSRLTSNTARLKLETSSREGVIMASLEELKAKYQSVLTVVQREQISLENLHLQDGKLFIKGKAPSMDAANKVWDEIKRINPQLNDIAADFP